MKVRAAIYCRISKDRAGAGLGVERQEKDCRDLAERLGWEVVAVYVDNDLSAYSGKRRPQYEEMLRAVKDGQVNGIVTWHTDRLTRRVADLDRFVRLADDHGLLIQTVKAGEVDLTTPSGRMVARTLGNIAQYEVEHAKDRMRAAKRQAAESGKYRGGPRPYGYNNDGVTVREDEAKVIRDATKAILAGRSLRGVANELNAKGHKTSTGKPWTYMRLRDVLVRPRNAGLVHKGRADRRHESREDCPTRFEVIGEADWPAIVDKDKWNACASMLLDPSRRIHTSTEPRWLGSRSYVCGVADCGALMRPTSKVNHLPTCPVRGEVRKCDCPRRYYYRCSEQNHLSIAAEKTDDFVREVVAEKVRDPEIIGAMLGHDSEGATKGDRERRMTLTRRVEQLEREWDDDLLDTRDFNRKRAKAETEIAEIDARLAEAAKQSSTSPIFCAADPGAKFMEAPVDVQRAVLRSLLRVTVLPIVKRGDKWSSERLDITSAVAS
ncbi:recombinase family protein [Nocardioides donggukensis]|uniref:Recombinase family protein n=1 Tax=Nocardioides donggukensis TaxID=2774019 RepID=A0A927K653_9ACTN|nr:recombinase family protein [Nocardioides donggukensis]MBD8870934.1 recombinase family protein [Nocardioides donggukensis]